MPDLIDLIARSRHMVAFTGAGISTESGIPDFRSPGGVWSKMKPISFQAFMTDPEKRHEAWERVFKGTAGWTGASPNRGHMALARLAEIGKLSAIITQNVDNLHQESGVAVDRVIELHGNASYATCLVCAARHELADLKAAWLATHILPACRSCGGIVKTATISFGQSMPPGPMARAQAETLACDLFVVLGSSLVVFPAADFPRLARDNGARLVIINREPTDLDAYADLVLHEEIGPLMETIALSFSGS